MLLGKLQSNELPTQLNFIDEAVRKYHSLELQHAANKEEVKMVQTMASLILNHFMRIEHNAPLY